MDIKHVQIQINNILIPAISKTYSDQTKVIIENLRSYRVNQEMFPKLLRPANNSKIQL